jgi:hypothetical protein
MMVTVQPENPAVYCSASTCLFTAAAAAGGNLHCCPMYTLQRRIHLHDRAMKNLEQIAPGCITSRLL